MDPNEDSQTFGSCRNNKKRRLLDGDDGGAAAAAAAAEVSAAALSSAQSRVAVLEEEAQTLRRQVKELKKMTVDLLVQRQGNGSFQWKNVPKEWQDDPEIEAAAVRSGKGDFDALKNYVKYRKEETDEAYEARRRSVQMYFRSNRKLKWEGLPIMLRIEPLVIDAALCCSPEPDHRMQINWKSVPAGLKRNPRLIWSGVRAGYMQVEDYPTLLDRAFLRNAVEKGEILIERLPQNVQDDLAFSQSIRHFSGIFIAVALLKRFHQLRGDRFFWAKVCSIPSERVNHFDLSNLLDSYASLEIRSDPELMVKAYGLDRSAVHSIGATLWNDRSFLLQMLQCHPLSFYDFPEDIQRRHLDLFMGALKPFRLAGGSEQNLRGYTSDGIWEDRDFVEAWFGAGLPVQSFRMRADWLTDRGLLTLIAANCPTEVSPDLLRRASPTLKNDKIFMLKVIGQNASLFRAASRYLQGDYDLCRLAFSGNEADYAHEHFGANYAARSRKVDRWLSQMEEELRTHHLFLSTVLPGIASGRSPLALLNQGAETALVLKKLVAEYLGVQTGKRLGQVRRAHHNLSDVKRVWGAPS